MCCFDQSGEQYGIDTAFAGGYKRFARCQRQRKVAPTVGDKRKVQVFKHEILSFSDQDEELLCE